MVQTAGLLAYDSVPPRVGRFGEENGDALESAARQTHPTYDEELRQSLGSPHVCERVEKSAF